MIGKFKQQMHLTFGVNFLNSDTQLGKVDSGAAIRNGPFIPRSTKYARRDIHWRVLPRPISSARIPLMPFSKSPRVQQTKNESNWVRNK